MEVYRELVPCEPNSSYSFGLILLKLYKCFNQSLGPVVQSIVSLMRSLVVKMLTAPVSTISNSQVFLLKNVCSFCKSYSYFFSKNISVYAIFNDKGFNDTLTNDIVCFEQLGPEVLHMVFTES